VLDCSVPFYIAAPTTSLDPSLASGDLIKIEERDPRELTHHLGRQVAAPGIDVRPLNCFSPKFGPRSELIPPPPGESSSSSFPDDLWLIDGNLRGGPSEAEPLQPPPGAEGGGKWSRFYLRPLDHA